MRPSLFAQSVRCILVVNLGGIGDLLLSTPALQALRRHFSGARIVLLCVPRLVELVRTFPFLDEVISFHAYDERRRRFDPRHVKDLWRLLRLLRARRFDLAVNMRTLVSWPSALKVGSLLAMVGARRTAGRDTQGRGFFFDIKVPETFPDKTHEIDYDLRTVRALGAEPLDERPFLAVSSRGREEADAFLAAAGVRPQDLLIGFHVGGLETRRWPIERYARVLERLDQQVSCRLVVTAGPWEQELIVRLRALTSAPFLDFSHASDLAGLTALIERCRVFVSNDTGPMHIAAVLERPLVGIFGGGPLERYDPRRIFPGAVVLLGDVDCYPCGRSRCRSLDCLNKIRPEEVLSAILGLLKAQGLAPENR